ncbi:hypothetical protein [Veillonella sp.]|uniref:hypothetical protein n=1 Tax=Veillonella sp. TaxID=1926307 RepID=UPI0025DCA829|nr:hypothetical protein [Veillonella sp.]
MIEQTKTMIQEFEARIKELLAAGYSAQQAVRIAYEEYPVMKALQKEVQGSLHKIAELGYGGLLANAVTDKAFKTVWAPDRLTLSNRTTRGAKAIRDMVAETLSQQMVRNANYKQNALDLFDGYGYGNIIPEQDIPEFMSKLVKLSNGPNYNKEQFRSAIRQAERQIKRLSTQGMEVAYKSLLSAIEARNDQALSKALYMATQERSRYFAERIARTERARAFIDGFLAKWQDDKECVAYQWKLSTAHPKHDICDLYANADLYGLGKGVYPKDKVPNIPVHPHCMCRLKPLFEGQVPDIEPKERIEEGGREYIATLTKHQKEKLLGINGAKQVESGDARWMEKAIGFNGKTLVGRISTGAISGALNDENDPWQIRRDKHAEQYYEFLRNSNQEYLIKKLSEVSGMRLLSIQKVLAHVLYNRYNLDIGYTRFDPSYEMSQSFQRLLIANGKEVQEKDIIMLKHERLEYELMNKYSKSYSEAHKLANKKHNYELFGEDVNSD